MADRYPHSMQIFENTTIKAIQDFIETAFTTHECQGCMELWIRFDYVHPSDSQETDYLEDLFRYRDVNTVRHQQAVQIFKLYHQWLDKVASRNEAEAEKLLTQLKDFDRPLKDSGQRRDFGTGSRRDVSSGKGRYDLLPPEVMEALAKHYEKGALKYDNDPDRAWDALDNWKMGQPLSVYLDSGLRHTFKWSSGMMDEDHLIAAIWNLIAAWWTQNEIRNGNLPVELGNAGELIRQRRDLTKKKE